MNNSTNGVIIGRFNPPHNGHRYLIDFASSFVNNLYIFVCTLERDQIPGILRYRWVKDLYPNATCIHITEENPNANRNKPGAHSIWAKAIAEHLPQCKADYLFASEDYGWNLAEDLGAEFIPVDPNRDQLPVSGTAIRNDPLKYWEFLPESVRPYFIRRIAICAGAESDSYASRLASRFGTLYAPRYLHYFQQVKGAVGSRQTIHESWEKTVLHAQYAMESALSRQANRLLFISAGPGSENIRDAFKTDDFDRLFIIDSLLTDSERATIAELREDSSNQTMPMAILETEEHAEDSIDKEIRRIFQLEYLNT